MFWTRVIQRSWSASEFMLSHKKHVEVLKFEALYWFVIYNTSMIINPDEGKMKPGDSIFCWIQFLMSIS